MVRLIASEPDGFMGYPGAVSLSVEYEVVGNELHFRYEGSTSKPTLLSMTNHTYWNLKGHAAGNVLDHSLMVAGSRTTEVDDSLAITGRCPGVEGTPLDLRATVPTLLQDVVDAAGPVDTNYCLVDAADWKPGGPEILAAKLVSPNGITMEVWTDQPGLQVFTGHNIDPENSAWWHGKGARWQKFGAVCLEPQLWPDGIHHESFPSPVLRPGETYTHHSHHVFIVEGE
jgi:aldose 1-epimerase